MHDYPSADSTQMLLGESTCSFRAGFEFSACESLEIGGAVNIPPLIEQRHFQSLRLGRIKRLGEYAVRAPVDSAKKCRMRTAHRDKVVAAVRGWPEHDAISTPVERSDGVLKEPSWQIGQIGTDDHDAFDAETKHVLEAVGEALAKIAAALRDHVDLLMNEFAYSLTFAGRLTRNNLLDVRH